MSYVQVFNLLPEGGSYYVFNDIFRCMWDLEYSVVRNGTDNHG